MFEQEPELYDEREAREARETAEVESWTSDEWCRECGYRLDVHGEDDECPSSEAEAKERWGR